MHYQIYIDEAGNTPYYNDTTQPVSAWGGVITNRSEGDFDKEVRFLLKEFGLPEETEFHAYEIFQNKGPFESLSNENRELILLKFLSTGNQYIDYNYACDDLNCFRKPDDRLNFESQNLSILERLLFLFITIADFYLHFKLGATYSLNFDKSDDFFKSKKLILELKEFSKVHYYLRGLQGEPNKLDSKKNRFIQLADAICDNTKKMALLETITYKGKINFQKHEAFIRKCNQIISPKRLPFVETFLANIEFYKNSGDPAVIELKKLSNDWGNRQFESTSGYQAKKKKPDIFDPSINTFWDSNNNRFNSMELFVDEFINRTHLISKREDAEVWLEVFIQLRGLLINKFKEHSFLPGFKELINKTEELVKKVAIENQLLPNSANEEVKKKATEILSKVK